MTYHPKDHVPKCADKALALKEDEIARRKALFAQARRDKARLMAVLGQRGGGLTRCEASVLGSMFIANVRATVRREATYRPTRAGLAKATNYSERSVSRALAKLKALGLIAPTRYAKGGRTRDGHGLSTEWASGNLANLLAVLKGLGYIVATAFANRLKELTNWARETFAKRRVTGTRCPGTMYKNHKRRSLSGRKQSLSERALSLVCAPPDRAGPSQPLARAGQIHPDISPGSNSLGRIPIHA